MPIEAKYKENTILIEVTLIGEYREKTTQAILDTGFSSYIVAPVSEIAELGLAPVGYGDVRVADGRALSCPVLRGRVRIGENTYNSAFLVLEVPKVILGMRLIRQFPAICLYGETGRVEILEKELKKAATSPLKELSESLKSTISKQK